MEAARPRGSSLAGSAHSAGASKSVMTRGQHHRANCITWGRLAWQVSLTLGPGPGGPCTDALPVASSRCQWCRAPVVHRMEGWPWIAKAW